MIAMLLWFFYDRPDLMGTAAPGYDPQGNDYIFAIFIASELPSGLWITGGGLSAAAISGLTSEINAKGSTAMNDCYKPLVPNKPAQHYMQISHSAGDYRRCLVLQLSCVFLETGREGDLIDFALMVMMYCYSGLVAIFLCAASSLVGK